MHYKQWFKKYIVHLLTGSLMVSTATAGFYVYATVTTTNNLNALQTQYDEQVQIALDLSLIITKLETEKNELTENLATLTNEHNQLLSQKSVLENNILALETEKILLNKDISDLETELESLTAEVTTLGTKITALNSQIAASAAALSSLSSQLGSLSSQNSQLSSQVSTLNSQISTLTLEVNSYVTQNASQIDFETVNAIAQETIKGNIRVVVPVALNTNSVGSGVIYKHNVSNNKYYALTNNHVTSGYNNNFGSIKVENYTGKEFNATVVAIAANDDLVILEISGSTATDFKVLELESNSFVPANDLKVISMGGPRLQYNTITLGVVIDNTTSIQIDLTDDNTFNPTTFPNTLSHNAVINKGSSGGALLSFESKIIGINFAGVFSGDPDAQPFPFANVNGYAINLARIYALIGTGNNWSLS